MSKTVVGKTFKVGDVILRLQHRQIYQIMNFIENGYNKLVLMATLAEEGGSTTGVFERTDREDRNYFTLWTLDSFMERAQRGELVHCPKYIIDANHLGKVLEGKEIDDHINIMEMDAES